MKAMSNDLALYERRAAEWWSPRSSAFRSLHSVNEFRLALLEDWIGSDLRSRTVVDLGCCGGLLALPLALRGASVIGVDVSHASLRSAADRMGNRFLCGDALRVPLASASADVVLLADVVEHVGDVAGIVREAARLLRAGGVAYVNTLNRTRRAKLLAVDVAETVGLIPRGTHDPSLFVDPDRLRSEAWRSGLVLEEIQGERVNVLKTVSRWAIVLERSDDLSVAYSALFRKTGNG